MNVHTKTVVTLTIVGVLAIAAISGATYAWYSDSKQSDVHVTSGEVKVGMNVNNLELYSMDVKRGDNNFENGGTASVSDDGKITIDRATPGDEIRFNMNISNSSTVNIKWKLSCGNTSEYVYCKINEGPVTKFNDWSSVIEPATKDLGVVSIAIGIDKEVTLSKIPAVNFQIELMAVQANTPDSKVIKVNSEDELSAVAEGLINNQSEYDGKTILIMKDLDMNGKTWPIINLTSSDISTLTIKGNESVTIKNLKLDDKQVDRGFISKADGLESLTLENLTIDGFYINGASGLNGAFIGYVTGCKNITVTSCNVFNSLSFAGDMVGGIIGYATGTGESPSEIMISSCSVEGSDITGNSYAGGIIGAATSNVNTKTTIIDCSVKNSKIVCTHGNVNAGSIIGYVGGGAVTVENYSVDVVTVLSNTIPNTEYIFGCRVVSTGSLTINGEPFDFTKCPERK